MKLIFIVILLMYYNKKTHIVYLIKSNNNGYDKILIQPYSISYNYHRLSDSKIDDREKIMLAMLEY